MARRTGRMLAALAAGAALAFPASAMALDPVLTQLISRGAINPCTFSEAQLRKALASIPNDLEQYAPDIRARIQSAIATRARGGCSGGRQVPAGTPAVVTPPAGGPPTATPQPQAPTRRAVVRTPPGPPASPQQSVKLPDTIRAIPVSSQADPPPPLVALAILLVLLAICAATVLTGRALGLRFGFVAPVRHAFGEAAYRLGDRFAALRRH